MTANEVRAAQRVEEIREAYLGRTEYIITQLKAQIVCCLRTTHRQVGYQFVQRDDKDLYKIARQVTTHFILDGFISDSKIDQDVVAKSWRLVITVRW